MGFITVMCGKVMEVMGSIVIIELNFSDLLMTLVRD